MRPTAKHENEQQKAYLLKLSDALRSLSNPLEIQRTATKILAKHLQADRALYSDFENNGHQHAEKKAFASMVQWPLMKGGQQVAELSVQQLHPREWTPEEVLLVRETAERTWWAVERGKAEEAKRMNEERLGAIKEVYQSIVSGASLEASLLNLTQLVTKEASGDASVAYHMVNEDGTALHPIFGAGNMPDEYLKEIDGIPVAQDALASIAEKYHYSGCLVFPIKTREDKVVGTLAMYFHERHQPTEQDIALAEIVTTTAAVVITSYLDNVSRAKAERLLKEANSQLRTMDEAKTNFFNNVSHEFRTPLTF